MKTASAALLSSALSLAGLTSLQSAQIDLARNSVKAGGTSLKAGSSLAPGATLSTGSKSKTQVSLGNSGSLMRAGSKTDIILQNDTTLSLRQGVMLASSGKRRLGRESVAVETPEIKASVKGSMLVAYQPESYIKITCIEGEVAIKLKALMGEFVRLRAGQMVIINPAGKQLPQEVEVDLKELNATSSLLGADFPELGAAPRLERAATQQSKGIGEGEVVRTSLVMEGAGLEVTLATGEGIESQRVLPEPAPAPLPPPPPPAPPPSGGGAGPPPPPAAEYIIDGSTVFTPDAVVDDLYIPPTLQTPGFPLVTGASDGKELTIWSFGNLDPLVGPELRFRGVTTIPESLFSGGDLFEVDGDLQLGDGADTAILSNRDLLFDATGNLLVQSTRIDQSSFSNPNQDSFLLSFYAGRSISLINSQLAHDSYIDVYSPGIAIKSSSLRAVANSGSATSSSSEIVVRSPAQSAAQGGIMISDSSTLQALAARSFIELETQGAPISVTNSQLEASVISLDTFNSAADSLLEIRNSVLNGDEIRARAYNTGDRDAIVISGSSFTASNLIKFYAEGASKLRFQGNTTLSTGANGLAVFAGKTVEVDNGGNVNVNGNLNVYRDVDNYNKAGFGNINVSGSQTHRPHNERPAYSNGGVGGGGARR